MRPNEVGIIFDSLRKLANMDKLCFSAVLVLNLTSYPFVARFLSAFLAAPSELKCSRSPFFETST